MCVSRMLKKLFILFRGSAEKLNFNKEKKMPKSRLLNPSRISLILAFAMALFVPSDQLRAGTQKKLMDQMSMTEILIATGEYCERIKQMALQYICLEKITDIDKFFGGMSPSSEMQRENTIFNVQRTRRQTYTYDYQLIKQDDELIEQRIMLEKNGRKRHQENADLSHLKYFSQFLIYGPVGFLSRYWQSLFTYTYIGEDEFKGEPVVIIQAVPNEIRLDNSNIGRIWINKDFQILRVEWEPSSIQNYEDGTIHSKLGEFKKKVVWTVDYSVEKNGILFPGQQLIQEIYFQDSPNGIRRKAVKREIRTIYDNYKYFIVESQVDWKKKGQ
jgi:hypothetical protein